MIVRSILTFSATAMLTCALLAGADKPRKAAKAELKDATGKTVGTATFTAAKTGVVMSVKGMGLPAGSHGIHIHTVGKCEAPGFTTAGGHFNPAQKKHGLENPEGHHMGDMPNMTVQASGKGVYKTTIAGVTLAGTGDNSLFKTDGTAVVIHEKADDMKTDPAGNAGTRIACGVIQ